MGKNETRRLRPSQTQANKDNFAALKANSRYAPANQAYTIEAITAVETEMDAAGQLESQTIAAAAAARDNRVGLEWRYHNLMLGARDQVVAQFGRDSNEAQAVGLKKKSEYKSPGRKKTNGDPPKE